MPTKEDKKLLEKDGWTVDCESPFEISDADGNRATGRAAMYVVEYLKDYKGDPLAQMTGGFEHTVCVRG